MKTGFATKLLNADARSLFYPYKANDTQRSLVTVLTEVIVPSVGWPRYGSLAWRKLGIHGYVNPKQLYNYMRTFSGTGKKWHPWAE